MFKNLWLVKKEYIITDVNTVIHTESNDTYINDNKRNGQDKNESAAPLEKLPSKSVTITSLKDTIFCINGYASQYQFNKSKFGEIFSHM